MEYSTLKLAYFSPTGTTRKILEAVAEGFGGGTGACIDLTRPAPQTGAEGFTGRELALLGVPVYGGRVPREAASRLSRLQADQTPAVVVVVYGNRAYEDALLELREIAREAGFIPVAGGAFIGEHSFANDTMPIANGRPDAQDLASAREFGAAVRDKLQHAAGPADLSPVEVPGDTPYKERRDPAPISPDTLADLCTLCGTCAEVCPVAAITVEAQVETDKMTCILCCACVKNCPTGARVVEEPAILKIAQWLTTNFQDRKEPEVFL